MTIKTPRSRTRTFLPIALAMAALTPAGCGGGGSSGGAPTGASLAFSVAWEQRATEGSAANLVYGSDQAVGADGAAVVFDTPIPPSVSAIRFILRPASGQACCVAVLRGSQAFIERHLQLADVLPGEGSLEVNGFPVFFAPNGGVTTTCATRNGDGTPCSASQDTLPSFGSDEIPVDVQAGVTNVVDVDVHSLPFLLNLDPADGGTADSVRPNVNFTVVDANHDVNPDVNIRIQDNAVTVQSQILTSEDCLDGDSQLPDCSPNGALEVRGLIITSRSPQDLPPGNAALRIRASNEAAIPRDMESNTAFMVPPGETSTTTSTTITTTSTTLDTTTTTLELPQTFCLKFSVSNAVDLVGVSYDVFYGSTGGDFTGSGDTVACVSLLNGDPQSTLTTFNDDDNTSTLSAATISAQTFSGPTALAQCEFVQVPPLVLGKFSIQVTEATAPDLTPASATVVVEETTCLF